MSEEKSGRAASKRRQSVTIHDVAKHAGVSSMTASRVVNGQHYVSEEMRKRVMRSVHELQYKPNVAARAARSGTLQVGMLYSNPSSSNLSEFLMGAFREGGNVGCQLLVEPTVAHPSDKAAVEKLINAGVDAIVLPPPLCDDRAILAMLRKADIQPISFATAEPREDISAVLVDDLRGASLMTQHLLTMGHRDIGFLQGNPKHSTAIRREEGFRAAMAEAGVTVNPDWVAPGLFTYREGLNGARMILSASRRPTAIFACNDDMAAAASAVAHGLGISIPGELSIAGFDDTPVASTIWPELTTIHQPIADMSATAIDLAVDQVRRARSGESLIIVHHHAELSLVERASTAPPRAVAPARRRKAG